jgi:hypothetical protein
MSTGKKKLSAEAREEKIKECQEKCKTKGGKRAKKEPGAPKRALSAYMYFTQSRRAALKSENPAAKITDLAKLMGAEWQALSEAKRKPHQAKADKDKTRYAKEKASWDALGSSAKAKANEAAKAAKKGKSKGKGKKKATKSTKSKKVATEEVVEETIEALEDVADVAEESVKKLKKASKPKKPAASKGGKKKATKKKVTKRK